MFDLHTTVCKFMLISSKEHTIDKYYSKMEIPSHEAMVHYIFHLTKKYEDLEQRFTKLQQSVITTRRKSIQEYLDELEEPLQIFPDWAASIEISDKILDSFLELPELKITVQKVFDCVLFDDNDNKPLRAFSQKQNAFYLYDKNKEWRSMTSEEFQKFIEKIEHKILRKFGSWSKKQEITSPKEQDRMMVYTAKLNGTKQPNRISELKKWLYSKIAVSLKQYVI
jgi:hypothetical protein